MTDAELKRFAIYYYKDGYRVGGEVRNWCNEEYAKHYADAEVRRLGFSTFALTETPPAQPKKG